MRIAPLLFVLMLLGGASNVSAQLGDALRAAGVPVNRSTSHSTSNSSSSGVSNTDPYYPAFPEPLSFPAPSLEKPSSPTVAPATTALLPPSCDMGLEGWRTWCSSVPTMSGIGRDGVARDRNGNVLDLDSPAFQLCRQFRATFLPDGSPAFGIPGQLAAITSRQLLGQIKQTCESYRMQLRSLQNADRR